MREEAKWWIDDAKRSLVKAGMLFEDRMLILQKSWNYNVDLEAFGFRKTNSTNQKTSCSKKQSNTTKN